jgi:CheY-like chemotaxis protein
MDPLTALDGQCILVIEDDYFGARALIELLESCGARTVGPIGWVQEALDFIHRQPSSFDIALLDINMHGEKSYSVADALMAHGKYFVFTTGYGAAAMEENYRLIPRCEKPFGRDAILAALLGEFQAESGVRTI